MEPSYYETMYTIREDEALCETFKKLKGAGKSRQAKAIYEAAFENIQVEQEHSLFYVRMMYSLRAILVHLDQCKACRYNSIYCGKCKDHKIPTLEEIYELSKVNGIGFCQSCV